MERNYLVKNVRNKLGLSQYDFAPLMGLDQSMISKWENKREPVTDSKIFELMYICEIESQDNEFTMVLFSPFIKEIVANRKRRIK